MQMVRPVVETAFAVAVLWAFAGVGGIVAKVTAAPIPGSVIGMLLLWGALEMRLVRLSWIDGGSRLLLAALGLLFVPAGAGFVQFTAAGSRWLLVGVVVIAGSLVTLGIAARIVERGVADDA